MADFVLTLGDFGFQNAEVPQEIPVGGAQRIATHNLIGGQRVADTLGRNDDDIEWSGWILGPDAKTRVAYLDNYRIAGTELVLSWSDYRYRVIVRQFNARFQRQYQYVYQICCEVIADLTNIASSAIDLSIDDAITADLSTANTLTAAVNDSKLSSLMSGLSSAVGAVSSFASATTNTINGVLAPLAAARSQVSLLISSSTAALSNVATLGGLLPGNPVAQYVTNLEQQVAQVNQSNALYTLDGVLGRIGTNLQSVGKTGASLISVGDNLFSIASSAYHDATEWAGIAQANGLTDPFVAGGTDLAIPPVPANTDGVLDA